MVTKEDLAKTEARIAEMEKKMDDIPAMKQAIFETLGAVKDLHSSVETLPRSQALQYKILESFAMRSLNKSSKYGRSVKLNNS